MKDAITSEVRKIRTTRLWWVLLTCMTVGSAGMAGMLSLAVSLGGEAASSELGATGGPGLARMVYGLAVSVGYIIPAILGALSVTAEVRHGTLDTTVLMDPRRGRVIMAKLLAVIPFGFLYGLAGIGAAVGAGAAGFALGGSPTYLDDPAIWRSIAMGVVAITVWSVVGVGLGAAVSNQMAVIVVLIGWTQLVEPILRMGLGFSESLAPLGAYLPGAAGDAMVSSSIYSALGTADNLPPWGGFLVLVGYAAVGATIGWLTTFRRDMT